MLRALNSYKIQNPDQGGQVDRMVGLITSRQDCFHRTCFDPGHITGSSLLISADGQRVLMNHHKKLKLWLCFGGHADGSMDVRDVSWRETVEESGIEDIELVLSDIFDIGIHPIPANINKSEPEHEHFDIRYLFRVRHSGNEMFEVSDESLDIRWCSYDEACKLTSSMDMHRMFDKWREIYR